MFADSPVVMLSDPKVDYAFKRVFGDQRNGDILVHLLNAVLQPEVPIRSVEILNPFSENSGQNKSADFSTSDQGAVHVDPRRTGTDALRGAGEGYP